MRINTKFRNLSLATVLAFLFFVSSLEADEVCSGEYSLLSEAIKNRAIKALQRDINAAELETIEQAINISPGFSYTPAELARQERLLKAKGFAAEDIATLRRKKVIGNSRVDLGGLPIPDRARIVEMPLSKLDYKIFQGVQAEQEYRYLVDFKNNVYIVPKDAALPNDSLWLIRDSAQADSDLHVIKESGILKASPGYKLTLTPDVVLDSTRAEFDQIVAQAERENPGIKIVRTAQEADQHHKILGCMDILSAQSSMKSAIFDRLIGDNMVVTSSLIVSELAGANRFSTKDGLQVVAADLIGANVNSVAGAVLGKVLVNKNMSLPVSLMTRTGVAMGMIEMQRNIYKGMLDNNAKERSSKIATFDQMYFFARLPVAHYTDQFILKKLPEMLYDACKRDSKVTMIVTPRSVRIVERYASTMLYYGARSSIINE